MSVLRATLGAFLFCALFANAAAQTPAPPIEAAQAAIARHDYKGAIAVLDGMLAQDPKNARALLLRGDAKDYLGDEKGAIADYDAAIAIEPGNAYAYATKCYSEVEVGSYARAIADCTKSIALNANNAFAYRGRANAHYFAGDLGAALADGKRATQIDPHDSYAFLTTCRTDAALGNLLQAAQDCTRSIALQPSDNAYFARGQTYVRLHDYPKAIADLRQSLAMNPANPSAYYWIAVSEAQQKDALAAMNDINAYVRAAPNDGDGLMLRAVLEAKQGRVAATRADAQEALRLYTLARDDDGAKRAQSLLSSLPKP